MSQNGDIDRSASKRAFQHGMMLALGIALIPVMLVSTGLFLSGHQPADFDVHLRYVLLAMWIVFLFTVNRLASLDLGRLHARLPVEQRGQVLTILVFSALLGGLRLEAGMGAVQMLREWVIGFILPLLLLMGLFTLFSAVAGSWRRNRARRRRGGRGQARHGRGGGDAPA